MAFYTCKFAGCSKSYDSANKLSGHSWIHKKGRVAKTATLKATLVRAVAQKTAGKHKCGTCSRAFKHAAGLGVHKRYAHGIKGKFRYTHKKKVQPVAPVVRKLAQPSANGKFVMCGDCLNRAGKYLDQSRKHAMTVTVETKLVQSAV